MKSKYNVLVGQSGGPTAAINATLAGVISGSRKAEQVGHVYGAVNGIEGVLQDHIVSLDTVDLDLLKQTPAAYLSSCRTRLGTPEQKPQQYETIFKLFEKYNIGCFLYIGGNDSMDTVHKLSDYAKKHSIDISVIGVPKTIDNDLELTDHTPGFGSAAKYIATCVSEIARDSAIYLSKSVTIIEIMGRNAGWLTAAAVLARTGGEPAPHLIYLPEVPFSKGRFIQDIKEKFDAGFDHIIVAVSEGVKDSEGNFLSEDDSQTDAFGHKMLSGAGRILEDEVIKVFGCKTRSIELSVLQRCAGHLLSAADIEESFAIGEKGAQLALSGKTGRMMVFHRVCSAPYRLEISSEPIEKIANQEKTVPADFCKGHNDVSQEMVDYLLPLILGEAPVSFENGLPKHLIRS